MGADFIFNTWPAAEPTIVRLRLAKAHLRSLPMASWIEHDTFSEMFLTGEEDEEDAREIIQPEIDRAIVDADASLDAVLSIDNPFSERRDVAKLSRGNHVDWISGGMSFGDNPTEACDIIDRLCDVPGLYELCLTWAQTDWNEIHSTSEL